MLFAKSVLSLITAATAVVGAPSQPSEADALIVKRQNTFYEKNWSNDQAVLTWDDRPGGAFAVNWSQPNGGNFVVGKGYNPGREM